MSPRKPGLGRGLDALIPAAHENDEFVHAPVDGIEANPEQPRTNFEKEALDELAASIREVGVLQPIVVAAAADGFTLVAGERRLRAARLAGLKTIPAVIRRATDDSALVESLVENVQRQDLTPIEEAAAFRQLLENYGMSLEQVADRVGKSRPAVSNALRLLGLPAAVQAMVAARDLSAGAARALAGLEDERYATYLAEKAVKEGWTVRRVEGAVRLRREMEGGARAATRDVRPLRPVEIIELEKRLGDRLGAKVRISYGDEKGKVEIRFGSLGELERIYRIIG